MRGAPVVRRAVVIGIVLCLLLGGCVVAAPTTPGSGRHGPRIELSRNRVQVDQVVGITVKGLAPRQLVELELVLERRDATWASQATFRADRRGRVDVAHTAPVEGDYAGVDPMGLLWSAHRQPEPPSSDLDAWTDLVHLRASVDSEPVAATDLVRHYLRRGSLATPVREQGVTGTLFEPHEGHRRRPTVITVGGSEGGLASAEITAAMLASRGYNALALAYFDTTGSLDAGLPATLSLIPLEPFTTAVDWLRNRPSVDPDRIGVVGVSKGAELALLLASRSPELTAVVAYAPSSVVWPGVPTADDPSVLLDSSWSENGQPVPFLPYDLDGDPDFYTDALADTAAVERAAIPVERIAGPVMLISGTDDQLWPSSTMADQVIARLRQHQHPYDDTHLAFDSAGHFIPLPYNPTTDPGSGLSLGGNPTDTARASRQHWPQVLRFLDGALR